MCAARLDIWSTTVLSGTSCVSREVVSREVVSRGRLSSITRLVRVSFLTLDWSECHVSHSSGQSVMSHTRLITSLSCVTFMTRLEIMTTFAVPRCLVSCAQGYRLGAWSSQVTLEPPPVTQELRPVELHKKDHSNTPYVSRPIDLELPTPRHATPRDTTQEHATPRVWVGV